MNRLSRIPPTLAAAAVLAGLSGLGSAAQAQVSFNHNKALAGNVTPGDAPGYPITISRSGHYKLTGNLTVPAEQGAIHITAPNVTIDLNGFTVAGPGSCTRIAGGVSCTGNGGATGVHVSGHFATLRNGTVQGFYRGVQAWTGSVVEDLTLQQNASFGLMVTDSTRHLVQISRVRAVLNAGIGMSVGPLALVTGSMAADNGLGGIYGASSDGKAARISASRAHSNEGGGFANAVLQDSQAQAGDRSKVFSAGGNVDSTGLF